MKNVATDNQIIRILPTMRDRGGALTGQVRQEWSDWKWQQQNAVTSVQELAAVFGGLNQAALDSIAHNLKERKLTLTPYVLSLVERVPGADRPRADDPVWKQLIPDWGKADESAIEYNGQTENWELESEMKTPICQHKYPNRVILRVSNVCHAYCQFCYEALRTLEKKSEKDSLRQKYWDETLDYIRANEQVEEVILSGGEPLMLSDARLDSMLASLRTIRRPLVLRLHTRALTFNPFRVTPELVAILARHNVQAIGLHVSCRNEITQEFIEAVRRLRSSVPILFANIPLLREVNDSVEKMHSMCMELYRHGVMPHYLYHFMPFSPGAAAYRTSVRKGLEIVQAMKRNVSNIAVPEFVLPHSSGKFTVPLGGKGGEAPEWTVDHDGMPIVRYVNWQGQTVEYSDMNRGNT